jgi:HlyD family secretion protein
MTQYRFRLYYLALISSFLLILTSCNRSSVPQELRLTGTLELTEHSVGARVAGTIVELNVKEGDEVKRGQVLAILDRFDQTKRDYERAEMNLKSGGGSEQAAELAKLDFGDQQIISPIDGVVLTKIREVGEVISPGTAILDLGDRTDLWIRVYVLEGYINHVRMGQPAKVHFDGLDQEFKGHVSFIATKAEFTPRNVQTPEERVTQAFAIKVTLDNPPTYLHPGVAADVTIDLSHDEK